MECKMVIKKGQKRKLREEKIQQKKTDQKGVKGIEEELSRSY